jgi:hypothetical protein
VLHNVDKFHVGKAFWAFCSRRYSLKGHGSLLWVMIANLLKTAVF